MRIFRHFEIARNLKSASIQAMLSNVLCNLVTAMPIISSITTTPISQQAFGELAFDVMRHVFAIHDEYGRFFDEIVYKRESLMSCTFATLPVHEPCRRFYWVSFMTGEQDWILICTEMP